MRDKNVSTIVNKSELPEGLVGSEELLKLLFPFEASRPCRKTLERIRKEQRIPSVKIGRLRLYSPKQVMDAFLATAKGGVR